MEPEGGLAMRTFAVAVIAICAALASLTWSGPARAQGVEITAGYGSGYYGPYRRGYDRPYYSSYRSRYYARPRYSARIVIGAPSYRTYSRPYVRRHYYPRSYATTYRYRSYERPRYRAYEYENPVSYRW